ncbi:MAG: hypothetical protein HC877_19265 [Thioploca sp.]|nr:hypothetical protein [Thioploca sp.]
MKLTVKYLFILTSLWCTNLWSSEPRQIELNDGSVISGEIIAFDKGTYTIKSGTLGTLEIKDADIRTIRSETTNPAAQSSPLPHLAISSELQNLQNLIMNNPEMMNSVSSLQDDPQFQAILQDPEVINAVTAGNLNGLLANPNFMKLLENKKVKEIAQQIEQQQ